MRPPTHTAGAPGSGPGTTAPGTAGPPGVRRPHRRQRAGRSAGGGPDDRQPHGQRAVTTGRPAARYRSRRPPPPHRRHRPRLRRADQRTALRQRLCLGTRHARSRPRGTRHGRHRPARLRDRLGAGGRSASERALKVGRQPVVGDGDEVRGRWARTSTGRPSGSRAVIVHCVGSVSICPTGHPAPRIRSRTSRSCACVATRSPQPALPRGSRSVLGAVAVSAIIRWSSPPTSMTAIRGSEAVAARSKASLAPSNSV